MVATILVRRITTRVNRSTPAQFRNSQENSDQVYQKKTSHFLTRDKQVQFDLLPRMLRRAYLALPAALPGFIVLY